VSRNVAKYKWMQFNVMPRTPLGDGALSSLVDSHNADILGPQQYGKDIALLAQLIILRNVLWDAYWLLRRD